MMIVEIKPHRRLMGRLAKGADLLAALEEQCRVRNITLGEVRALGAVTKARVGYYDQEARQYGYLDFHQPLEIVGLYGNVSLKDGRPMVHAHVTLADEQGRAFGGHLAPGTEIFACEFVIEECLAPEPLARGFDEETGLFLWR